MIISASRRTDIPAFHPAWMMERLREGYALVRNPFNAHQISRVSLTREDAEAIVFWTKDAANMLPQLDELDGMGLKYLFQYTLTPYGNAIERKVDKKRAADSLMKLSARIGSRRVIWRYDPILLNEEWTPEKHIRMFEKMCIRLEGAAQRCVISFVDLYASVRRSAPEICAPDESEMRFMAGEIARIARAHRMIPSACAESIDLSGEGLETRGCIDPADLEALLGMKIKAAKDQTQRAACRCVRSVDIGAYDACGHDCIYCYARTGRSIAGPSDPCSPILTGSIGENDRVTERKERGISTEQISIFD